MKKQVNIAAHLPAMAKVQPHALAVVFPESRDAAGRVAYTHFTFRQLDVESDRLAAGLAAHGIERGARTVLMVSPSLAFFALTFALFKLGAVPVLIDPGMGLKNLKQCLTEAQAKAFIGIPKAHLARILLRWPRFKRLVTVGTLRPWGGLTLTEIRRKAWPGDFIMADTQAEETAAILFTSGSTGVPKGAVYSHGIFASQVEMLRETYGIEPGEIDLATFPLFALFAPALGMTAIVPDMDPTRPARVDPLKMMEAIDNFGVTNMFGSPALLDRVGRFGVARGVTLPSLKRVISAGAPVQAPIIERFTRMLSPQTQVFTPYGATESLPVSSIGSQEILGETAGKTAKGKGICVGRPVSGIDLKIIKIDDGVIEEWSDDLLVPDGEIGEIAVRGPVVTRAYFNRPRQTALAKIKDPSSGGFFHRMGDLGYLDTLGRLWFCGRKSQRVATESGVLFTIPCEGVFNEHSEVHRTALVGVPEKKSFLEPVLCVELEKGVASSEKERIRGQLLELGAAYSHTQAIRRILFHPSFPVDIRHNAKIFREKLAAWAGKQRF